VPVEEPSTASTADMPNRSPVTPVDVKPADAYIWAMCGRVIQSSPPIRYALFDGMDVAGNYA